MASATMLPGTMLGSTSPGRAQSPGARKPPLPAFSMRVAGSPGIALLTDSVSAEADRPALLDRSPASWVHAKLPKDKAKDDQFSDRDTFIYTDRVAELARQGFEIRWASVGWTPAKPGAHELPDYLSSLPVASQGTAWLAAALAALAQYPLLLDGVLFPALSAGALKLHLFDPNSCPESFQPVEVMINDLVPCQMGLGRAEPTVEPGDASAGLRATSIAVSTIRRMQASVAHRAAPPLQGRAGGAGADGEVALPRPARFLPEARHGAGKAPTTYTVQVLAAKNLHDRDGVGLGDSDPFCQLYMNDEELGKTDTIKNNLNPDWTTSANFSFEVQGVEGS